MSKGRKPKPAAIKELEGNPGKRPIQEEVKYELGIPGCPKVLDEQAKIEWDRIIPELERVGILMHVDVAALAAYCQLYSRWCQLEDAIKNEGLTIIITKINRNGEVVSEEERTNPKITEARLTLQQIRAFCSEFGFTPASRSKVTLTGVEEHDDGILD